MAQKLFTPWLSSRCLSHPREANPRSFAIDWEFICSSAGRRLLRQLSRARLLRGETTRKGRAPLGIPTTTRRRRQEQQEDMEPSRSADAAAAPPDPRPDEHVPMLQLTRGLISTYNHINQVRLSLALLRARVVLQQHAQALAHTIGATSWLRATSAVRSTSVHRSLVAH